MPSGESLRKSASVIRGAMWGCLIAWVGLRLLDYWRIEGKAETVFQIIQGASTNCLMVIAGYVVCRAVDAGFLRDYATPPDRPARDDD